MRILLTAIAAVVFAVSGFSANAEPTAPTQIMYSAIPSAPTVGQSSIVQPARGYYCRRCRRSCSRRFKFDCYDSERWCRRQFTRCMSRCWYRECR